MVRRQQGANSRDKRQAEHRCHDGSGEACNHLFGQQDAENMGRANEHHRQQGQDGNEQSGCVQQSGRIHGYTSRPDGVSVLPMRAGGITSAGDRNSRLPVYQSCERSTSGRVPVTGLKGSNPVSG